MSNLVPVQFDKTTGRIRLTRKGLAIGQIPAGFFRTIGYLHEEPNAVSVWNVNHNASTEHFNVQIFDITGHAIIPDEIIVVDNNNTDILFTSPFNGKAVFTFFIE